MSHLRFLLVSLTVLLGCGLLQAQNAAEIHLGDSAVPLYGPWKFTVGDSPVNPKTGRPLWAEPGFDDSKWQTVDLTPENGSADPINGQSGYIPGWAAFGHAGHWGYAWYRIQVHVDTLPGMKLALLGPADVDDAYQAFANGKLLGQFGDFKSDPPTVYNTQPMMFPLPSQEVRDAGKDPRESSDAPRAGGSSTQVLAFRVYLLPGTLTMQANAGGFHSAPVLGDAGAVNAHYQMNWLELTRGYAVAAMLLPISVLMALLAFTMILVDRSDPAYLWIGAVFLLQASRDALLVEIAWTQTLGSLMDDLLSGGLVTALSLAGWVMVWWVWFGRQRPAWTPRAATGLAALFLVTSVVGHETFVGLVPHSVATAMLTASMLVRLLFLLLQLWIVSQGIRRYGLEGWIVLPAVVLWGVSTFINEISVLHLPIRWSFFGLSARLGSIAHLLLALVVVILLLRRMLKSIQRQRQMALDVKQAQEVQQVILPESITQFGELAISSAYRPAREVGGDFFQLVPNERDGSLLIVAGDVAGKGLQAGMLVALLVGAIRSTSELNSDPLFVLEALNRRLLGRGDAHATCLALRIEASGAATLANAGHLPPYLNGESLPIEGSMPLGFFAGAEFSVLGFDLQPNDRLVITSDGLAEATDGEGHLLGFEAIEQLARNCASANEIANAAEGFGQEDDISVIVVTRIGAAVFA